MLYRSDNVSLCYLKDDNVFIDGEGEIVFEIFELISPNDLYLFRRNQHYTVVNHHTLPGVFVELYWPIDDEEDCGFDVGDDYERIKRYEKARLSGCYRRFM